MIEVIGNEAALGAWLIAAPGFVKPVDLHREQLKQLFDDVTVGIVKMTPLNQSSHER